MPKTGSRWPGISARATWRADTVDGRRAAKMFERRSLEGPKSAPKKPIDPAQNPTLADVSETIQARIDDIGTAVDPDEILLTERNVLRGVADEIENLSWAGICRGMVAEVGLEKALTILLSADDGEPKP